MAENSDQPETYSGIGEAADALMAKAQSKTEDTETSTTEVDTEEEETEETEVDETETDEGELDDQDDQDEDDDADEEEDDEESDEDNPDDSDDESSEFLFEVEDEDGNKVGVTADEARLGYLRQRDYTKKTQALSTEQKEVEGLKSELTDQKGQLANVLQQLQMAADTELAEFAGIDWVALEKEDPYEYEEKARRYDALRKHREQAIEYNKQLQAQYQQEAQERLNALRAQEQQKLFELAPELNPEVDEGAAYKAILDTAINEYGFQQEELEQIFDHRATLLLRDAHRYHELKSKVTKGKAKVKEQKTLKPSTRNKPAQTRKSQQRQKLKKQAQQTGSLDDALNFLISGMGAK